MRSLKDILIGVGVAVALLLGFLIGQRCPKGGQIEPINPKVDTLFIQDTIAVSKPVYLTRRVVDSVFVPATDTVRMRDTMFVYLEREQIRWEDSLSVVFASGINPQVDSVTHLVRELVITKEIPVIQTRKTRWGIGVQAGYGAGKNGLTPFIGVGVSYNLATW